MSDDVSTLERRGFFRLTTWKRNGLLLAAVMLNVALLALMMALRVEMNPQEGFTPLMGFHVRLAFEAWQTYFWIFSIVVMQVVLGHRQLAKMLDGDGMIALFPEDKSNGRKFGALSGTKLVKMVMEVAERLRAGRIRRIVVSDRPDPNAYTANVLGVGNIVVLHSNLLEIMPAEGVRAIVAHEVGHIRQKDSLVHLVAGLPRSFVAVLGVLLLWKLGAGLFWFDDFVTLFQRLALIAVLWGAARWAIRQVDTLANLASQQSEFLADAYAAFACGWGPTFNALLILGERSEALHAVIEALKRQPHLAGGIEEDSVIGVLRRLPPGELNDDRAAAAASRLYIEVKLAELREELCVPFSDEDIVNLAWHADKALRRRQADEREEAKAEEPDAAVEQHLVDWRAFDWDRSGHLDDKESAAFVAALEADRGKMLFRQFSEPDADWLSHPTMRRRLLFLWGAFRAAS